VADPRGQGVLGPIEIQKKGQFLEKRVNFWGKKGKKMVRPPIEKNVSKKSEAPPP